MSARSAAGAAAAAATRHWCSAHGTGGLGRQAGRGEDREQPPGADVAVGATRRRVGIGHGPALVKDGVTGRTAELVDGHVMNLRCGSLREHACHVERDRTHPRPHPGAGAGAPDHQGTVSFRSAPAWKCADLATGAAGADWARGGLAAPARQAALGGGRWCCSELGSGGCSFWLRRRLWKPQSKRPLSCVVSPPEA